MRTLRGHVGPVRCVAYAPDSRLLASGGEDGTATLWQLPSGNDAALLSAPQDSVETLTFSTDGKFLAGGTAKGQLILWDSHRTVRVAAHAAHVGGVRCIAAAPTAGAGDRRLGSAGVPLGSAVTSDIRAITANADDASAVAIAPDGTIVLARGLHGALHSFDLVARALLSVREPGDAVLALAYSPDGRLLAAGHAKGDVSLWEMGASDRIVTLQGHTWTVYAVALTPDGRTLVSGGADGTVRLWDVAARRQRVSMELHTRWVTCVAVAPDGMTAAAESEDGTIVVWDLDEG